MDYSYRSVLPVNQSSRKTSPSRRFFLGNLRLLVLTRPSGPSGTRSSRLRATRAPGAGRLLRATRKPDARARSVGAFLAGRVGASPVGVEGGWTFLALRASVCLEFASACHQSRQAEACPTRDGGCGRPVPREPDARFGRYGSPTRERGALGRFLRGGWERRWLEWRADGPCLRCGLPSVSSSLQPVTNPDRLKPVLRETEAAGSLT
jgi:hypothetical protein